VRRGSATRRRPGRATRSQGRSRRRSRGRAPRRPAGRAAPDRDVSRRTHAADPPRRRVGLLPAEVRCPLDERAVRVDAGALEVRFASHAGIWVVRSTVRPPEEPESRHAASPIANTAATTACPRNRQHRVLIALGPSCASTRRCQCVPRRRSSMLSGEAASRTLVRNRRAHPGHSGDPSLVRVSRYRVSFPHPSQNGTKHKVTTASQW
jgi:hypothetical protein